MQQQLARCATSLVFVAGCATVTGLSDYELGDPKATGPSATSDGGGLSDATTSQPPNDAASTKTDGDATVISTGPVDCTTASCPAKAKACSIDCNPGGSWIMLASGAGQFDRQNDRCSFQTASQSTAYMKTSLDVASGDPFHLVASLGFDRKIKATLLRLSSGPWTADVVYGANRIMLCVNSNCDGGIDISAFGDPLLLDFHGLSGSSSIGVRLGDAGGCSINELETGSASSPAGTPVVGVAGCISEKQQDPCQVQVNRVMFAVGGP